MSINPESLPDVQTMRNAVLSMMVAHKNDGESLGKVRSYSVETIRAIYTEMVRADTAEYKVRDSEIAHLVYWDSGERTIREYIGLKPWHAALAKVEDAVTVVSGIHYPNRNKESVDFSDPLSVKRNAALLKAAILIREIDDESLTDHTLRYEYSTDKSWVGDSFYDPNCSDLLLDYPEHWETLVTTMHKRGYENGIESFRVMMTTASPLLMEGTL